MSLVVGGRLEDRVRRATGRRSRQMLGGHDEEEEEAEEGRGLPPPRARFNCRGRVEALPGDALGPVALDCVDVLLADYRIVHDSGPGVEHLES